MFSSSLKCTASRSPYHSYLCIYIISNKTLHSFTMVNFVNHSKAPKYCNYKGGTPLNNHRESKQFCDNVYKLRKLAGLSQKKMAQLLGIGIYSLRKIERGTLPPRVSVDIFFRLRNAFHICIPSLFLPIEKLPEGK